MTQEAKTVLPVEAPHGEKMVEVKIRFWTDKIAEDGKILPGHVCDSGMLTVERNDSHGLRTSDGVAFNSLLEIPYALEKLIIKEGLSVHPMGRARRYAEAAGKAA